MTGTAAPLRLAFMGTPDFAVPTLEALAAAGHEIAAVYTQPPRRGGRGKMERPSPVQVSAEALGLAVRTPASLKVADEQQAFAGLGLDAAVVVAFGQILPPAILAAPRLGCLNLHASLLPRWRGAAPIQRAVMAGDGETGACAMLMEEGLDTGPVLARCTTRIDQGDTAGSLHDRLAVAGAALMAEALSDFAAGRLRPEPQAEHGVTYAHKIDKTEACIDWDRPAGAVDGLIRGLSPFPGAWFDWQGERIKVLLSERASGDLRTGDAPPGTVLDERLAVACAEGAVRLLRLQRAGKGAMDAVDLLRGFPLPAGSRLGEPPA